MVSKKIFQEYLGKAVPDIEAVDSSLGVESAGKLIQTDENGKLDNSFFSAEVTGSIKNNISEGRLTTKYNNTESHEQNNSDILYYSQHNGNKISLVVSGELVVKEFGVPSINFGAGGYTVNRVYDIFAYWDTNSSSVKIEALAWSDNVTRAVEIDKIKCCYKCKYCFYGNWKALHNRYRTCSIWSDGSFKNKKNNSRSYVLIKIFKEL